MPKARTMLRTSSAQAATPLRHRVFPWVLLMAVAGCAWLLWSAGVQPALWAAAGLTASVSAVCLARTRNVVDDWGFAAGLIVVSVLPAVVGAGGWAPWLLPAVLVTALPMMAKPAIVAVVGGLGALALVATAAAQFEAVPWVAVAFGLVHIGLLTLHAASRRDSLRERFDIEFMVRAMGLQGAIRLDFDAVRAETEVGRRLKAVQDRIGALILQVRGSTQQVHEHANALRSGSDELRERTTRSAEGLRDAAMTLEQITAIVQASANGAAQARTMAVAASEQAQEGAQAFSQVAARMEDINAAARRITDVVGVIDNIAFQTNILALNAAVEAARAGDQGRGFAVVAAEVRSLALRASKAAGEVKSLIETALATTRQGSELVHTADGRIKAMVESVLRVGEVFAELSADTQQHAGSIDAVTRAVMELDQVTRMNVALVDTTQSVAASLLEHGAQLEEHLGGFRVSGKDPVAPAAQAPKRPKPAIDLHAFSQTETLAARPAAPSPAPANAAAPADAVEFF